jgi:hypothetical protein
MVDVYTAKGSGLAPYARWPHLFDAPQQTAFPPGSRNKHDSEQVVPYLLYRSLVLRASAGASGRHSWDGADHRWRSARFSKPTSREGSRRHNSQAPVGLRERHGNTTGRRLNRDERPLGCSIEGRWTCSVHPSRLRSLRNQCPARPSRIVPPSAATRYEMPALTRYLPGRGIAASCNAVPPGSGAAKSRDSYDMRRTYLGCPETAGITRAAVLAIDPAGLASSARRSHLSPQPNALPSSIPERHSDSERSTRRRTPADPPTGNILVRCGVALAAHPWRCLPLAPASEPQARRHGDSDTGRVHPRRRCRVGSCAVPRLRRQLTGRHHGGRRVGSPSIASGAARCSARRRMEAHRFAPRVWRQGPGLRRVRGDGGSAPSLPVVMPDMRW